MTRPGLRVRDVDDRRRQVGVDRQVADVHPRRDARPAHLERHPDRLLVDVPLDPEDPVLAVEEAVVGGEDDQGVVELAVGAQRVDDLLDALVHREQRLERAAVACAACPRSESRSRRGWLRIAAGLSETSASLKLGGLGSGSESNAWAWRGAGFAAPPQSDGGFGFGSGPADVRRRVGEPEEERLRLRRAAVDEADRLPGQHVLLEVGRVAGRSGPGCRSR